MGIWKAVAPVKAAHNTKPEDEIMVKELMVVEGENGMEEQRSMREAQVP